MQHGHTICYVGNTFCDAIQADMRKQSQNKTKIMKKSLFPIQPVASRVLSLSLLTFVRSVCRRLSAGGPQSSVIRHLKQRFPFAVLLLAFSTGCQVLTYHSPTGERFTRRSLGATTAI